MSNKKDNKNAIDDDWEPPTEAEEKALKAKRERNDKISKLMGECLLKGYKMLATTCRKCDTIEMQDQKGKIHCVDCNQMEAAAPARGKEERVEVKEEIIVPKKAYLLYKDQEEQTSKAMSCSEVLLDKIEEVKEVLRHSRAENIDLNLKYVQFIKESADCILALKSIHK